MRLLDVRGGMMRRGASARRRTASAGRHNSRVTPDDEYPSRRATSPSIARGTRPPAGRYRQSRNFPVIGPLQLSLISTVPAALPPPFSTVPLPANVPVHPRSLSAYFAV